MIDPLMPTGLEAERITALKNTTDAQLLRKAADIAEGDLLIAKGTYRIAFGVASKPPRMRGTENRSNYAVPCHCLWGSVREAAGIYAPDLAGVFEFPRVVAEFSFSRSERIARLVALEIHQIHPDRVELSELAEGNWFHIIYTYSDIVLHYLGTEGPARAAEILRGAADRANDSLSY